MTPIAIQPKALRDTIKPACAAIRKQTTPSQREQAPIMGAVRVQYCDDQWQAAPVFDSIERMDRFPNPDALLDVLLDLDAAYALALTIDPTRPATLTVTQWDEEIRYRLPPYLPTGQRCTTPALTISQPSACPGRADTMRFTVLEV